MKSYKNKIIISLAGLLLSSSVLTAQVFAQETAKNEQQTMDELWGDSSLEKTKHANADRGAWFSQDKYSMFIHWGLYSQPAGEWQVDVAKAGDYFFEVEYSADEKVDFSEWIFNFNGEEMMVQALDKMQLISSGQQLLL